MPLCWVKKYLRDCEMAENHTIDVDKSSTISREFDIFQKKGWVESRTSVVAKDRPARSLCTRKMSHVC